ncbi:MAG: hypothetical protein R3344_08615, partial [Acidobacteriota bacterium]|nr:hypothetical protein [Acidobacteriota bacterium]
AAFADEETAEQRERGLAQYLEWHGDEEVESVGASFDQAYPPGWFAHRVAFSPHGRYGAWLMRQPSVLKIGETVYVHGGITPELAKTGLAEVNKEVIRSAREYLSLRSELAKEGVLNPLAPLGESFLTAEAWYRKWQVTSKGKENKELAKKVREFHNLRNAIFMSAKGPLWNRELATADEKEYAPRLEKTLATLDAERIVIAHTTTTTGKIVPRFDGRVLMIDTGSGPYYGGHASALEIADGAVRAIYPAESENLAAAGRPAIPANGYPPPDAESSGYPRASGESDADVERFLLEAEIVETVDLGTGTTKPLKVTLQMNGETRKAVFKSVNVEKSGVTRFEDGTVVMNFTDKYHYDRAAYLLDRHLEIYRVPVTVFRRVKGQMGGLTEWVEGCFTEGDRREQGLQPPDTLDFQLQEGIMDVFDALIHNDDRNLGNVLIREDDWRIFLIDHSRSFRTDKDLEKKFAGQTAMLTPELYEKIKALDIEELKPLLKGTVSGSQIKAMLKRRDLIVEKIEADRAQLGDPFVLKELVAP